MIFHVRTRGGKEIARDLRRAARETDDEVSGSLMRAAKLATDEISRRARHRSGKLASSITAEPKGKAAVRIYPKGTHYYAGTQEFGGVHTPKRSRFMVWGGGGALIFAKRVRIPARPFFYPGWEAAKGDVLRQVEEDLMNWIRRRMA